MATVLQLRYFPIRVISSKNEKGRNVQNDEHGSRIGWFCHDAEEYMFGNNLAEVENLAYKKSKYWRQSYYK